jgi:cytosine/adenosine deaminase-related metal-dependent hydrolase
VPPEFDLLVADARVLRPDGTGARSRMVAHEHGDLQVHTRLDETSEDAQAAHRRFGRSSVSQLDHIGLLGPRLACAHAVHVSASDIDRLAATGTVVVRLRAYRRELAA